MARSSIALTFASLRGAERYLASHPDVNSWEVMEAKDIEDPRVAELFVGDSGLEVLETVEHCSPDRKSYSDHFGVSVVLEYPTSAQN